MGDVRGKPMGDISREKRLPETIARKIPLARYKDSPSARKSQLLKEAGHFIDLAENHIAGLKVHRRAGALVAPVGRIAPCPPRICCHKLRILCVIVHLYTISITSTALHETVDSFSSAKNIGYLVA